MTLLAEWDEFWAAVQEEPLPEGWVWQAFDYADDLNDADNREEGR